MWIVAGIKEPVFIHYLPKHQGELGWIRHALCALYLVNPCNSRADDEEVCRRWIEAEAEWFKFAAVASKNTNIQLDSLKRLFIISSFFVLVAHVVLDFLYDFSKNHPLIPFCKQILKHYPDAGDGNKHALLILLCAMLLVTAGLIHVYEDRYALKPLSKQFARMFYLFDEALRRFQRLKGPEHLSERRELILSLGKESLRENADWIAIHRDRPLEVPVST